MKKLEVLNIDGSLFRENCGWCLEKRGSTTKFCKCLVSVLNKNIVCCDKREDKE